MIKTILKLNGARSYEVHAATSIKNATTGGKGKKYEYLTQVYACISPKGSNIQGLILQATPDAGDIKLSDFVMISAEERFEKERILYRGLFYEIRSVENPDNGILRFFKSYLVKVDNQ